MEMIQIIWIIIRFIKKNAYPVNLCKDTNFDLYYYYLTPKNYVTTIFQNEYIWVNKKKEYIWVNNIGIF